MIDNYEVNVPQAPAAPVLPTYSYHDGSGKKLPKSKKKLRQQLKKARKELNASAWREGYVTRENEMLKRMILLATATERNRLNSTVTETGLRLTAGKGGR